MNSGKRLSLRENAGSTKRESAPPAAGAGQTIQTLNGTAELGTVLETASWASGFGLLKLGYDALTYFGGAAGCALGIVP